MSEADKVRLWYMQQDAKAAAHKASLVDFMHTGVLADGFEMTHKDIADMLTYRKKEKEDAARKRKQEEEAERRVQEAYRAALAAQEVVDTWMAHVLDWPCTAESITRRLSLYNENQAGEEAGGLPVPRGTTLPKLPVEASSIFLDLANKVDTILKASFEAVGDITGYEYYS